MKRKKRTSILIERREISLFASTGDLPSERMPESQVSEAPPEICPSCGAPDMLPLTELFTTGGINIDSLRKGVGNGQMHVHCTSTGNWWVCSQSLKPI
jgi:hypothetical protein